MEKSPIPVNIPTPVRVNVYVDGFNLYYGLREANFQRFYWLDIYKLAISFLRDNQRIGDVKYFTARISGPSDKKKRQNTFLEALAVRGDLKIFEGQFLAKSVLCNRCTARWQIYEEKMTDVNIATEMLIDAIAGRFDRAIIVSADSDLIPPIRAIRGAIINREVIAAFPPQRTSIALKKETNGYFQINSARLAQCQFPEHVVKADGFVLQRPASWK